MPMIYKGYRAIWLANACIQGAWAGRAKVWLRCRMTQSLAISLIKGCSLGARSCRKNQKHKIADILKNSDQNS
jgi:hypothetical protein